MNIFSRFSAAVMLLAFVATTAAAQQYRFVPEELIIVNGGRFGQANSYVTMGAYNFGTGNYTMIDSVTGNSVADITFNDDQTVAFVATDSILFRYDFTTNTRTHSRITRYTNSIALYGEDRLVVSYDSREDNGYYVRIFNANTLNLVKEISGLSNGAGDILVKGDTAYVAVPLRNPSFENTESNMAVIDMFDEQFVREDRLGPTAKGVTRIFDNGDEFVLAAAGGFGATYGSFMFYDADDNTVDSVVLEQTYSSPVLLRDDIVYGNFAGSFGTFDLTTGQIVDSTLFADTSSAYGSYIGAAVDTVSDSVFISKGDFTNRGMIYMADADSNYKIFDSVRVGVSAQVLAVRYDRVPVSIADNRKAPLDVRAFPNPVRDELTVRLDLDAAANQPTVLTLTDLTGRINTTTAQHLPSGRNLVRLNTAGLTPGIYILTVERAGRTFRTKIVKR